jgi:hypothetical protein
MTPGSPEDQEPISELFCDVFALAEQAAQRITDDEVDARLNELLRKTGRAAPPAPDPAGILDAARGQARGIVADAKRTAAQTEAEAARAARSAEEAARREAERIITAAEEYADKALNRAAAIIADARLEAESIIAGARKQAGQIAAATRPRAASLEQQAELARTIHAQSAHAVYALFDLLAAHLLAGRTPTALLEPAHLSAPVPDPADLKDRLSMSQAASDPRMLGSKTAVTPLSRALKSLKYRLNAPQDSENPGWIRKSMKPARPRRQSTLSITVSCFVVARADGTVTTMHIVRNPDDVHVSDLLTPLASLLQSGETLREQPASQDDEPAVIRGNRATLSIEASH